MDRRGFLKVILAAGAAPAVITTAGVLMPVKKLWTPEIVRFDRAAYEFFELNLKGIATNPLDRIRMYDYRKSQTLRQYCELELNRYALVASAA